MQHPDRLDADASKETRSRFTIQVKPPFRLDLTAWALRRRPRNQVDRWDGTTYRRALYAGSVPVEVAVAQRGGADAPRLRIDVIGLASRDVRRRIRPVLDRLLGLNVDLAPFYRMAARYPRLNDLAEQFRGMRPPRFPTLFEALLNGISCQQLSLEAGLILLNRLTDAYGQAPPSPAHAGKPFPRPRDLVGVSLESLRALGFSRRKGLAIVTLAAALERNEVDLDALEALDDAAALAKLDELRGIGRWTAEYVLLRGFGRLNIFPGDDIGARRSLQRWLRPRRQLDYTRTEEALRRWKPYGGLVYLHLLLKSLAEKGIIAVTENSAQGGHSRSSWP